MITINISQFLLWSLLYYHVDGFANNLVITKIGCMTELDTSEVIMNNVVKAPEESDFPNMHLAVVADDDNNDNNMIESPYHYSSEIVRIAFVNPYSKDEFDDDLQYVMEVDGPAEFIGGGAIGCDGNRRASARLMDSSQLTLKIFDTSSTLRVWGGWATGHNAVRLTENLMLKPRQGREGVTPENDQRDKRNKPAEDGTLNRTPDKDPNLDIIEATKTIKHKPKGAPLIDVEEIMREDRKEKRQAGHMKMRKDVANHGGKIKAKEATEMRPQKMKPSDNKLNSDKFDAIKQKHFEKLKSIHGHFSQPKDKKKSFREHYDSDEFADQFHMQSYIFACIFFILTMGYTVLAPGRRRVKGRRDL
jgi:hypothetical protein